MKLFKNLMVNGLFVALICPLVLAMCLLSWVAEIVDAMREQQTSSGRCGRCGCGSHRDR